VPRCTRRKEGQSPWNSFCAAAAFCAPEPVAGSGDGGSTSKQLTSTPDARSSAAQKPVPEPIST